MNSTSLTWTTKSPRPQIMALKEEQWLWSPIERRCLSLLQSSNTRKSILQIHCFMLRNALETNINLFTKFIAVSCSATLSCLTDKLDGVRYARHVFDHGSHRGDTFLCNSMIKAHVDNHQFPECMTLYRDLKRETCFLPDSYSFPSLLKSCGYNLAFREGHQLHGQVVQMGFLSDLFVSTVLVDMYVKFRDMETAREVFDQMPQRSRASWTSVIVGYAKLGGMSMSKALFDQMPEKDLVAFNAMLDAYVKSGNIGSARELFDEMPERNVVSWTTLIDGYCKIGDLARARLLFDAMPTKNLVSWNAMIGGYCQNKQPHEALKLFREMQSNSSFQPDDVTIVSVLPAIADLGAVAFGGWVQTYVHRKKLDRASNVCTALIDMFAKCGEVAKAKQFFNSVPNRETSCWNAMINGFAINGQAKEALEVFMKMLREGVKPNEVTIIGVLSACNHGGLVEEARKWFNAMRDYGLSPRIDHYGCMVDILGRAGRLEEAEEHIRSMPYEANGIILSSFLFACGRHGDVEKAERVMKKAFEIEPWNDGNYVIMRNLYAKERRWKEMEEIEELMRRNKAKKEVGCSSIEIGSNVWEFVAGDRAHQLWELIDWVLEQLRKHMKGDDNDDSLGLKTLECRWAAEPTLVGKHRV